MKEAIIFYEEFTWVSQIRVFENNETIAKEFIRCEPEEVVKYCYENSITRLTVHAPDYIKNSLVTSIANADYNKEIEVR